MSEQESQPSSLMVLPAFGKAPALKMEMANIRHAEKRLIEAKTVNPFTYADLEHTFNEAYRDLKKHIAAIGYSLTMAQKSLEDAKADVILGSYAEAMKDKPKSHDTLDMRNAYLTRDEAYSAALERIAQLKALESNMDGKIKVMENVCRYMRKQMDLILRSGMTNKDYYSTLNEVKKRV
jgi:prefoldin subunit 5